jgi:hypothetical protein
MVTELLWVVMRINALCRERIGVAVYRKHYVNGSSMVNVVPLVDELSIRILP